MHIDVQLTIWVTDKLLENGMSVWVDVSGLSAGVDFLSKIGEAIIDAKVCHSRCSMNFRPCYAHHM